jgi:hypothetical protein
LHKPDAWRLISAKNVTALGVEEAMPIYSCDMPSVDDAAVFCMLWSKYNMAHAGFPSDPTVSQFVPKDADLANFSRVPGEFVFETPATMQQISKLMQTGIPWGFVHPTTLASLKQLPADTQMHHTAPIMVERYAST